MMLYRTKLNVLCTIAVLLVSLGNINKLSAVTPAPWQLMPMQDHEAGGECGCYYYLDNQNKPEAFVLYWPFYDGQGKIKIDGTIQSLNVVDDDILKQDYDPNAVKFTLSNSETTVSGVCQQFDICSDNEDCEITGYRGTLTVQWQQQTRRFAIRGSCGC
ncbi:MAG: hypothetical protein HWE11_12730 [Gammaproteobacteria bacterium]|nr:hypothetical protein [Gammaproteobacteria bacterium]